MEGGATFRSMDNVGRAVRDFLVEGVVKAVLDVANVRLANVAMSRKFVRIANVAMSRDDVFMVFLIITDFSRASQEDVHKKHIMSIENIYFFVFSLQKKFFLQFIPTYKMLPLHRSPRPINR